LKYFVKIELSMCTAVQSRRQWMTPSPAIYGELMTSTVKGYSQIP